MDLETTILVPVSRMNESRTSAFVNSASSICRRCYTKRLTTAVRPGRPPLVAQIYMGRFAQSARHIAAALAAVAISVFGAGGMPRNAFAASTKKSESTTVTTTKQLRYDGRQELGSGEKALSLALTGGAFALLVVMAYRKNRKEDQLETIRIKEEVERLEKLKAEFENVEEDDDALDDDEFMAQLNKRIAQDAAAENADDQNENDSEEKDNPADGSDTKAPGTATLDRPAKDDEQSPSNPSQATDDIDKLRRMWAADSPDDDERKNTKK